MDAIVAASPEPARRRLAQLTRAAGFEIDAVLATPGDLAGVLRTAAGAWLVTGESVLAARPFMRVAHAAEATAIAVVADAGLADLRAELFRGHTAVLQIGTSAETLRVAVAAARAGLAVWAPQDPGDRSKSKAAAVPLSPQERRILEFTGAGQSTKAVARQLGISPNTVKFHLQAAFEKLGATSRAEAVMEAIRRGELAV